MLGSPSLAQILRHVHQWNEVDLPPVDVEARLRDTLRRCKSTDPAVTLRSKKPSGFERNGHGSRRSALSSVARPLRIEDQDVNDDNDNRTTMPTGATCCCPATRRSALTSTWYRDWSCNPLRPAICSAFTKSGISDDDGRRHCRCRTGLRTAGQAPDLLDGRLLAERGKSGAPCRMRKDVRVGCRPFWKRPSSWY